jgi:hypothetical protein
MRYYRGLPPSSYFTTEQVSSYTYNPQCNHPDTIPNEAIMALLLIPIRPAGTPSRATVADRPIPQIFQSSTRLTREIICPPILCPTIHLSATLTIPLSATPTIIPCRILCQRILRPRNHPFMGKRGLFKLHAPQASDPTPFRRGIACPRTLRQPTVPGGVMLHATIGPTPHPAAMPILHIRPLVNQAIPDLSGPQTLSPAMPTAYRHR